MHALVRVSLFEIDSSEQWSWRDCRSTQRQHPCRCGNWEMWDDSRLSRLRRDLDKESSEESQHSAWGEDHDRNAAWWKACAKSPSGEGPQETTCGSWGWARCSQSRMMLRKISPVQHQAVTGTAINQVPVRYRWKAVHFVLLWRVKRPAEAVLHRDSRTRARSSNDPMPGSGMDMNSIVTHEQCEQITQLVL